MDKSLVLAEIKLHKGPKPDEDGWIRCLSFDDVYAKWEGPEDGCVTVSKEMEPFIKNLPWHLVKIYEPKTNDSIGYWCRINGTTLQNN